MADPDVPVLLPPPGVRGIGGGIRSNFLTPTSSPPLPRLLKPFSLLRRELPPPPPLPLEPLRVAAVAVAAEPTAGDGLAAKWDRFSFPEVPGVLPLQTLMGSWMAKCACFRLELLKGVLVGVTENRLGVLFPMEAAGEMLILVGYCLPGVVPTENDSDRTCNGDLLVAEPMGLLFPPLLLPGPSSSDTHRLSFRRVEM